MDLFINARFLSQKITGVQRYALELVKALDELIELGVINGQSICLLAPSNIKHEVAYRNIGIRQVGKYTGHLWEQMELPKYAKEGVLLNLCNTAPLFHKNQIVTIHDASVYAFPKAYSMYFRIWYKMIYKFVSKNAQKILTVSNYSKNELSKYCKLDENKIAVIYEGKEQILNSVSDERILRDCNLKKNAYLLAVSSINPNKNFNLIVKAIEQIDGDCDIAIAGNANNKVFSNFPLRAGGNVKLLGYVGDGQLRALYENAACFVYPSFYEGFGLPPLEAMACGCPVIVSNTSSLPEVCGDAALYCDPFDPKDLAQKINILMTDNMLREYLQRKGLERASQFTWEKCARETWFIIERVLLR